MYYFVSNHTESCPPLAAERLLTSIPAGQSFEGLTVSLQCRGNYAPYPRSVVCRRKKVSCDWRRAGHVTAGWRMAHAQVFSSRFVLEWSGVPVCHPTSLVSAQHWRQTLHAQSVVCSGDEAATSCSLRCVLDYVAVEEEQYKYAGKYLLRKCQL